MNPYSSLPTYILEAFTKHVDIIAYVVTIIVSLVYGMFVWDLITTMSIVFVFQKSF